MVPSNGMATRLIRGSLSVEGFLLQFQHASVRRDPAGVGVREHPLGLAQVVGGAGVQLAGGAGVTGLLGLLGLADELVGQRGPGAQEVRCPGVLAGVRGVLDRPAGAVNLVDQPAGVERRRRRRGSRCRGRWKYSNTVGSSRGAGFRARTASLMDFTPPWAVIPPSTGISAPEMYEASSLSRNTTSGATSSTVPVRPSGVSATLASRKRRSRRGGHRCLDVAGVDVLTRIPRGPSSRQAAFASPRSAHLLTRCRRPGMPGQRGGRADDDDRRARRHERGERLDAEQASR